MIESVVQQVGESWWSGHVVDHAAEGVRGLDRSDER